MEWGILDDSNMEWGLLDGNNTGQHRGLWSGAYWTTAVGLEKVGGAGNPAWTTSGLSVAWRSETVWCWLIQLLDVSSLLHTRIAAIVLPLQFTPGACTHLHPPTFKSPIAPSTHPLPFLPTPIARVRSTCYLLYSKLPNNSFLAATFFAVFTFPPISLLEAAISAVSSSSTRLNVEFRFCLDSSLAGLSNARMSRALSGE